MQDLVVLGTGGNAQDLLDVVDAINSVEQTWRIAGMLDDARPSGHTFHGHPVLGGLSDVPTRTSLWFASTIWNVDTFRIVHQILEKTGIPRERFATLVHPGAHVSERAKLGRGVIVNYGASVAGDVLIDDLVSVGPGCIIGHDSEISSFSTLAPASVVGGNVTVGSNCYLGSGSLIRQFQTVGDRALVGMGAVVVANVEPDSVVIGNPARPLRSNPASTVRE